MKNITKRTGTKEPLVNKQRNYTEIIEFLDSHWNSAPADAGIRTMKKLDQIFGNIARAIPSIFVTGTNGKSLTVHFVSQILKEEGLSIGAFYSPHILTYNERFTINNESISNKLFTDLANEVINAAETLDMPFRTLDILSMMSLLHFSRAEVDAVIFEISDAETDPLILCQPRITAITRLNSDRPEQVDQLVQNLTHIITSDTQVISADQNKGNLNSIQQKALEQGGLWHMPIRKLIPLVYPFEQLHGRCAALAERVAHVYMNTFMNKENVIHTNSLLMKQRGQRGRPTLEAKRQQELHPKRTINNFWKEVINTLPGRFQLLEKEKPTVLLDNASTLDAFENLFLGIRLLHYQPQHSIKGLTLILGCHNHELDMGEFLKRLRYFFKKTSGQVIICPVAPRPGVQQESWDVEKVTNDIKSMKIKAMAKKSFKEAFDTAVKTVDERYGLVVIAGSHSVIHEYWSYKGIKKFS